ncbi:hypothetical protein [Agrobacterium sp. LY4]|uniref:hypothetical protein n=1 Tax=Agrobacterium sp. LY4 TaxID=477195 RepID=UPI000745A580|nr:hypothetical protein [Agrobacterium sp. LY4]KVK49763.1 hypothetical protein L904_19585 [Agrobacterium sp. LY4]
MASRERVVEFAVKARDEYSKVLKNLEQQQKRLSASAAAQNRRAVVGVAKGEIEAAVDNYKRLNSEVDRYRAVQANAARTGSLSAAEMRNWAIRLNWCVIALAKLWERCNRSARLFSKSTARLA